MPSGTQDLQREITDQYQSIDQLWNKFGSGGYASGMDQSTVQQVKEHVVTARDALKNARDLIGRSSN